MICVNNNCNKTLWTVEIENYGYPFFLFSFSFKDNNNDKKKSVKTQIIVRTAYPMMYYTMCNTLLYCPKLFIKCCVESHIYITLCTLDLLDFSPYLEITYYETRIIVIIVVLTVVTR